MMRKQYTAAFKARVVQEMLKEEKTLAQIAAEYEVHATQLKNWRTLALEGLPGLFERRDSTAELRAAQQRALGQKVPLICNSDQGSHFTSPQYCQLLQAANVQISMDGKGRALDNIFTERLWRTVKYEEVYIHDYTSPREARQALTRYFEFYNHERLHQALDYQIPAEVYFHTATVGQRQNE